MHKIGKAGNAARACAHYYCKLTSLRDHRPNTDLHKQSTNSSFSSNWEEEARNRGEKMREREFSSYWFSPVGITKVIRCWRRERESAPSRARERKKEEKLVIGGHLFIYVNEAMYMQDFWHVLALLISWISKRKKFGKDHLPWFVRDIRWRKKNIRDLFVSILHSRLVAHVFDYPNLWKIHSRDGI